MGEALTLEAVGERAFSLHSLLEKLEEREKERFQYVCSDGNIP